MSCRVIRGAMGRRKPSGVAAVELALVLPLLVTIVLGVVDLGRFAYAHIALSNAARAGADFASVNPYTGATEINWRTQVRQKVASEMQPIIDADQFGDADLVVTATRSVDPGSLWRVRVEAQYPFEMLVSWPLLPNRIDLRRAVEMRGIR
ncbi:MAG TPA: TadE/TadG family type IV pilus assembly protein [Tepidisphaeraceae bacterium]|nr:TadE/TadG family type IV pilus assembly protein [Tepidisphaeraceae bacterium]